MQATGQVVDKAKVSEVPLSAPQGNLALQAEDITVTKFLGKGAYATVYQGSYKGKPVAIKAVPSDVASNAQHFAVQSFVHEAMLMQQCHHRCAHV